MRRSSAAINNPGGDVMTYVKYTISIPEGMVPYLSSFDDPEEIFARDEIEGLLRL